MVRVYAYTVNGFPKNLLFGIPSRRKNLIWKSEGTFFRALSPFFLSRALFQSNQVTLRPLFQSIIKLTFPFYFQVFFPVHLSSNSHSIPHTMRSWYISSHSTRQLALPPSSLLNACCLKKWLFCTRYYSSDGMALFLTCSTATAGCYTMDARRG